MTRVLQVVPHRPPPQEALAQVAASLAGAFATGGGLSSRVVAAAERERFDEELDAAHAGDALLLHYVGYGYAPRGAPLWLARTIERWMRSEPRRRLLVHFHEVAASGPPWRSAFWTALLQARVAARLARLAGGAITGLDRYADRLRSFAGGLRIEVLPIFSAIGEPAALSPWRGRERALVVFGSRPARRTIWGEHREGLERAVRDLGLERVFEIGGEPVGPEACASRPVERLGELGSERVSDLLSRSRAAFFAYPLDYLDKSSAFAAACAHGLLPICAGRARGSTPVAGEGRRWLGEELLAGYDEERCAGVAAEARCWYEGHDLRHHADTWTRFLGA